VYSPGLIQDQIALLDSIYENPAYLEDHEDPLEQFVLLEDTIAVRRRKFLIIFIYIFVMIGCSCIKMACTGKISFES
jgi:hypothetical protein